MKSTGVGAIIIGLMVIIAGGYYYVAMQPDPEPTVELDANPTPTSVAESSVTAIYEYSDVAQHNTRTDCWMVIDEQVYDVTEYIDRHPGGDTILEGCGNDATEIFKNRPQTGTSHSERSFQKLPDHQIGTLDDTSTTQ